MRDLESEIPVPEKKLNIIFLFFSAHLCPQTSILLSSADNLCKHFGSRTGPTKLSCENARIHVQSQNSIRCSREKCYIIQLLTNEALDMM